MNNILILKILRDEGPLSMAQLSKKTMLTLPAISAIISELEKFGLVKNTGMQQVKRGRFPALYEFDCNSYHIVSLAIRSDSISAALVNLEGKILEVFTESIARKIEAEQVVCISTSLIEKVISHSNTSGHGILGLGISMHGIVDPIEGICIYPAQFRWRNYPFIEKLRERFNFPMKMDNDMNCLLLAERWFGGARDTESFVIVNVDYGVGTGIMTHASVLRGEDFGAGQIGHISISDDEIQCDCGKTGCLEALASEKAILQRFKSKLSSGRTSKLLSFIQQDINNIMIDHVYKAASEGDELAIEVIEEAGKYLGKGIAILVNTLNPRKIIIAGGILKSKDIFFSTFQKALYKYALPTNVANLQIYASELQKHSDVIGAAALWIEALFNGKVLIGQQERVE
jgi:glucokinase-like ROK family protein